MASMYTASSDRDYYGDLAEQEAAYYEGLHAGEEISPADESLFASDPGPKGEV